MRSDSWGCYKEWSRKVSLFSETFFTLWFGPRSTPTTTLFLFLFCSGLIQHRLRPTYWSPSSLTALAESELKYNDNHRSLSIYAWWKVETEGMSSKLKKLWEKKGKGKEVGLAVWTTTGWTLMANQVSGGRHTLSRYVRIGQRQQWCGTDLFWRFG